MGATRSVDSSQTHSGGPLRALHKAAGTSAAGAQPLPARDLRPAKAREFTKGGLVKGGLAIMI